MTNKNVIELTPTQQEILRPFIRKYALNRIIFQLNRPFNQEYEGKIVVLNNMQTAVLDAMLKHGEGEDE